MVGCELRGAKISIFNQSWANICAHHQTFHSKQFKAVQNTNILDTNEN